jgi:hypothetical protein
VDVPPERFAYVQVRYSVPSGMLHGEHGNVGGGGGAAGPAHIATQRPATCRAIRSVPTDGAAGPSTSTGTIAEGSAVRVGTAPSVSGASRDRGFVRKTAGTAAGGL